MAEGRMLKKRVSKSEKLAKLRSDSSRSLYFFIYPHIDVEGRCEASLIIIKGTCVPYIRTFTLKKIQKCLDELHKSGLIILYNVNGYQYLQITRFHDYNRVDREKEAKSVIPAPPKNISQLQASSGVTPAELRSRSEISQVKSREVNISQGIPLDCKADLYKILKEIPELKETESLITLFCSGQKARSCCYDLKKCHGWLKEIVDKTIKIKPENYYGYVKVSIEKFCKGEGFKAK